MYLFRAFVCVFAVLLIVGTLAAEIAYDQTVKTSLPMMGETEVKSTVYIKGEKEKTESLSKLNVPVPGMTQSQEISTTVIARLDKDLIWIVDESAKTYTEIGFSQVREMLEEVKEALPEEGKEKAAETPMKMEVTRLEEREKVGEYECERVRISMTFTQEEEGETFQMVSDVWLAEEKGLLKEIGDFNRKLEEISTREGGMMEGLSSVIPGGLEVMAKYQEKLKDVGGFPVLSEVVITTEEQEEPLMKLTTRVENIRKVKLEDSEFEIPEGYQKLGGETNPLRSN